MNIPITDNLSLFEKYGGTPTVKLIVKEFYVRILETPNLARYFINTDVDKIIKHQISFISYVLGKPVSDYTGKDMKNAHINVHVTLKSFEDTLEILEETLLDFNVDVSDVELIIKRVNKFKNDIV